MMTETNTEQKITKEEIKHIANLARIEISADEEEKYAAEMSAILGYIGQLNKANTNNVKPTAQVTGLTNIVREDETKENDAEERKRILECVPTSEEDYIKVKSVF